MIRELKGKYCKDCKIFADTVEDEALSTIYSILDHPAFDGAKVRIMPDTHQGKGIVIGFTSTIGKYINPDHIGCDIGCTIDTWLLDKSVNPEEYPLIEHRIREAIKFGFEIQSSRIYETKEFMKFLKSEYSRALSIWPEMINPMPKFDEKFISQMLGRIGMDEGIFYKSIGSVGSGNHYIEVGCTKSGEYAFTVHTGSRNFGLKVWKYWNKMASSTPKPDKKILKEIQAKIKAETKDKTQIASKIKAAEEELKKRTTPLGYLADENLRGYLSDMVICQAYAKWNHKIIGKKIVEIFYKINQAKVKDYFCSVHNYVDFQDKIIRKGAIRAHKDEIILIPFNMRDGIALCRGLGNEDWNCSGPHGSGRKLSRSKAKMSVSIEEFKETMKDIYSTSVCPNTLDESPQAYKDTQEIKDLITETAEILEIIKPVISIKATDGAGD